MEIQKFEYLKNEKSFLDEILDEIVFEGLPFGDKNNFLKNSGHKLDFNSFSKCDHNQQILLLY